MAEMLTIRQIAELTRVDKNSVKALMGTKKEMPLDEFNKLLDQNYATLRSELAKKDTFSNSEICALFGCSMYQGMPRSHKTNSLVLISDTESDNRIYGDFWDGDIIHYTGMGTTGDQRLDFQQNKTLANSRSINIFVALFSKFIINGNSVYVYRGEPHLIDDPYKDTENGRIVYRFPLGFNHSVTYSTPEVVEAIRDEKQKCVSRVFKRLSPDEQRRRALSKGSKGKRAAGKIPKKNSSPFKRSQEVKNYALARANGICECCGKPAPFMVDGEPFLVCHHIKWLENGGDDTIFNTSGICPNCHSKIHILNLPEDTQRILENMKKDEKSYSGIEI